MAERVLIVGESGGIGAALAEAHRAAGWSVTGLSRSRDRFDVTEPERCEVLLQGIEPGLSRIIVATGALEIGGAVPEKSLRQVSAQQMMDQFAVNAVGPALVLRHAARLMPRGRAGLVAVLTARVGSIGDNRLGGWYSYRASKAAANQIVHTAAIELARTHRALACIAYHPGTVATRFTEDYRARHASVSPQDAAQNAMAVFERMGAAQTGQFFDWAGEAVPW